MLSTYRAFTQENTTGYTDEEIDALNAELEARLIAHKSLYPDATLDDLEAITKAFCDEVSHRV